MMAKPIRALDLYHPMIQFLIRKDILRSSNSKIDEKDLDTIKPRCNEHIFFSYLAWPFVISRCHCIMLYA